jgi:hypothetical protein
MEVVEIDLLDGVEHEPRQVVFGQPLRAATAASEMPAHGHIQ